MLNHAASLKFLRKDKHFAVLIRKHGAPDLTRYHLPAPRPEIFFVYAMLCANDAIYIGQTQDLQKRWVEHSNGSGGEYTSKHRPVQIIHYEEVRTREEAVDREKRLKTGFGRKWLRREWKAGRTRQAGGTMKVFSSLLRSIVFQQLSGHAARAIHGRFIALFPKSGPTPALVLRVPTRKLRSIGLSAAKVTYMRDLAEKYLDGTINEKKFGGMTSREIVHHLVQVKGIGVWTAHMLLIFTLHRLDILPTGDLAIRKGFQTVYKLKELPSHERMEKLAEKWRAHASIASWYLWRVADEQKKKAL